MSLFSSISRSVSSYASSDGDATDYVGRGDDLESLPDSVISSGSNRGGGDSSNVPIPRRLRPLNLLPFTPWVVQRLNHAIAPSINSQQLHRRLQVLDSHLRADCFVYESADAFRQGKLLLLHVWKRMLVDDNGEYTMTFASLVLALAQRYEFDLIHMHSAWRRECQVDGLSSGLIIGDPLYMEENSGPSQCLARAYHCILARTAALVFQMDVPVSLRIVMASLAFFRLPFLCAPLLDAAVDVTDHICHDERSRPSSPPKSCEPTGIQEDIETFAQKATLASKVRLSDQAQFFKFNPSLFHWVNISMNAPPRNTDECNFLNSCKNEIGFVNESAELVAALQDFRNVLGSDAETLHLFVSGVVAHVTDVAHGSIHWSCVPGLWPLLSAAIRKLQGVRPLSYSNKIRRCLIQYLRNPDMLQFLVRTCLESTPVHAKFEVNAALDLIGTWISAACSSCIANDETNTAANSLSIPLPHTFCFKEFFAAVNMLLDQEHFQILIKTLTLIYSNCGRFIGSNRMELCRDILCTKYFKKLFFHWCPEVRRRFHYILIYKFNRCGLCEPPYFPPQAPTLSRSRNSGNGGLSSTPSMVSASPHIRGGWLGQGSDLMRSSLSWISSTLGSSVSNILETGSGALPSSLSMLSLQSLTNRTGVLSLTRSVCSIQQEVSHCEPKEISRSSTAQTSLRDAPEEPKNEENDPQPHACVLIRTKLSAQAISDDNVLVMAAESYISQIEAFAAEKPSADWSTWEDTFDLSSHIYAAPALCQYNIIKTGYIRLQRKRSLRYGEVLAPELNYEMIDPVNIDSLIPVAPVSLSLGPRSVSQ
uniref:Uncharacterized protein n=1 Tax=Spongospora subterranea TaxID=70186 RepID=A0A0H5R632_9EUKA|eukprot:CRZ09296.1 hypothetical protein [Spongospora subterranea]